jgi:ferritin heavy chain
LQWFSETWDSLVLFQGAHFSRDTINRPGFAKLFFEAASEERQHAIKIISYLLMRGELTSEIRQLIQNPVSNPSTQ